MITLAALNVLHFWIVFVATGVLLSVLAWAGGRRRKLSPKQLAAGGIPAACGSCGYDLTGLPGHICPECGSDLELVGRLSPQFQRWTAVPVTARLIVWTVGVAAFAMAFLYAAVEYSLPRRQVYRVIADWAVQAENPGEWLATGDDSYNPLVVRVDATYARRLWPGEVSFGASDRVQPDEGTVWSGASLELSARDPPELVEYQGQQYYAHRKPPRKGLVYLEPDSLGAARIMSPPAGAMPQEMRAELPEQLDTPAAILLAMDQAAYDGAHGAPQKLATDLSRQIDDFLRYGGAFPPQTGSVWQPWMMSTSSNWRVGTVMGGGNTMTIEQLPLLLASGFWFAVWIGGLPFIIRKRPLSIRREVTEADRNSEPARPEAAGA